MNRVGNLSTAAMLSVFKLALKPKDTFTLSDLVVDAFIWLAEYHPNVDKGNAKSLATPIVGVSGKE